MARVSCGHRDNALAIVYKWPAGTVVRWYLYESTVPSTLSTADVVNAMTWACIAWASKCGIRFERVFTPQEARIVVFFAGIDGAWNTLGMTELPIGLADARHRMQLDSAEHWEPAFLNGVILHELGHGIGIGHAPAPIDAVMEPIYDPGHTELLAWDADQAVSRYGDPGPTDPGQIWLRPLVINFSIHVAGDYQITGSIDTVSGSLVNPALLKKG